MGFFILILSGLMFSFQGIYAEDISKSSKIYSKIKETYGKYNLSAKPAFQGGYINFGYWKNIQLDGVELTPQDRILASQQLYQLVFDELKINRSDTVLEVGCGLGNGCISTLKYHPKKVTCIDITPEQIQRAKNKYKKFQPGQVYFFVRSAQETGFKEESFSKIYSVEAAQYFPSMEEFSREAYRILKKGGKLVVTAHFSTNKEGHEKLSDLIPTVQENVDQIQPIESVLKAFKQAGFRVLKLYTIGEDVFKGNDKWFFQVKDIPWSRNIYKAYKLGYMDYYMIVLEK